MTRWTFAYLEPDCRIHSYHAKNQDLSTGYRDSYRSFVEGRNEKWALSNKKPDKLRDTLSEFNDLCYSHKCFIIYWKSQRYLRVLLDNGTVAAFTLSSNLVDAERILLDKSLCSKLGSEIISDAAFGDNFIVFSFYGKSSLLFVLLKRPLDSLDDKMERLSSLDPKFLLVDIPGLRSRHAKLMAINSRQSLVALWWSREAKEENNLVIIDMSSGKPEMHCSIATQHNNVLTCTFSVLKTHCLYTVEGGFVISGQPAVSSSVYEYAHSKLLKVAESHILIQGKLTIAKRNYAEDKLFLACDNGLLILHYDNNREVTHHLSNIREPTSASWHPSDILIIVGNSRGRIQCFDVGLAPLRVLNSFEETPSLSLDVGLFLSQEGGLDFIEWCHDGSLSRNPSAFDFSDCAIVLFRKGPACLLRFVLGLISQGKLGPMELVTEYIRLRDPAKAVNILKRLNWNTSGKMCFTCFTLIMDFLLKQSLSEETESLCEEALATFLSPSGPILDAVTDQFREGVHNMARRFHHHLLRYQRLEKAYLLAVDLEDRDLFMDLHFLARDAGESVLSQITKRKAEKIRVDPLLDSLRSLEGTTSSSSEAISGSQGGGALSTDQIPLDLESSEGDEEEPAAAPASPTGSIQVVHFGMV
ncbi:WD repeat-containing and planar cell polarity effector protein fritz homolog isoform X2 [Oscarella lobularis]|uniref:WD repeat-containing and planar cell polarity effector protein fritz homolog isoform X2 n=1 Tax=Oscarella lobularis TaxID=121494 RepID=UPI003313444A